MKKVAVGTDKAGDGNLHVVIGGGGYPGYHLGLGLFHEGHKVKLVDISVPIDDIPDGVKFEQCDVCNYESVEKVLEGAYCVYHMASYGMSGSEQLNKSHIQEVNITGTQNVIKACQQLNIAHLVYTSTYNVVFGGQEIENGDESLPYFPVEKHPDHYSRTKALAEMLVLDADSSVTSSGHVLYTCALRLGAVYGPGERRHLPRLVSSLERGLFKVKFGKKDSRTDFLHIDNLVQAHIMAGEALTASKKHIAAGQTYFISDAKPINNFEFFRPLVEGLGYSFPDKTLPFCLIYFIAFIIEKIHSLLHGVYNFSPLLTRAEVNKLGVTHYFSIAKAEKHLGYRPTKQNELGPATEWFIRHGHKRRETKTGALRNMLLDILLAVVLAVSLLSLLPCVT